MNHPGFTGGSRGPGINRRPVTGKHAVLREPGAEIASAAPLRHLVQITYEQVGCDATEAEAVADHLVEANLMGHESHGVIRVAPYIELLRAGKWATNRHVEIVRDAGALVVVDGGNGIGQVIAKEAIDIRNRTREKARRGSGRGAP